MWDNNVVYFGLLSIILPLGIAKIKYTNLLESQKNMIIKALVRMISISSLESIN